MTDLTRRYGRASRGQRVRGGTPGGHWHSVALLGAVGVAGWMVAMSLAGAADGDVFLAYLQDVLGPQLRAGDVVVMDNLSAHMGAGVRALIEARGGIALSAALLARLQSHRSVLVDGQT